MPSTAAPAVDAAEDRRNNYWRDLREGAAGMGGLPLALLLFVPRTSLSFLVIGVAMACRAVARLLQTASGYKRKANLRILIVTDYMPPQTHGIAVRFRQYIDYMRKAGHEVQVFCTDIRRDTESSFDHPNLPSIVNPYNVKNRVAYSSGAHGHPGAPSPPSPPSLAPFSPLPSPSPSPNPAPLSPSVRALSLRRHQARLVPRSQAMGPRPPRLPVEHRLARAARRGVAAHTDLRLAPRRHEVLHL